MKLYHFEGLTKSSYWMKPIGLVDFLFVKLCSQSGVYSEGGWHRLQNSAVSNAPKNPVIKNAMTFGRKQVDVSLWETEVTVRLHGFGFFKFIASKKGMFVFGLKPNHSQNHLDFPEVKMALWCPMRTCTMAPPVWGVAFGAAWWDRGDGYKKAYFFRWFLGWRKPLC